MLHKEFSCFGKIVSAKVDMDFDYTSRGFGFVTFESPEDATAAIERTKDNTEMIAVEFKE